MSTGTVRSRSCLRNVLAAIVLIGVALGILILWIPTAREAARRNQCSDNLRQIATALDNYHDKYRMFPMGAMHSGPNPGGEPPVEAKLGPSWWFGIMPFVEPSSDSAAELAKQIFVDIAASQRPGEDAHYEFCADDIRRYETGRSERTFTGQRGGTLQLIMLSGPWYMRCVSSPLPFCENSVGPISLPSYVGIERWGDSKPLPGCSENHGINNPLQSRHPGGLQAAMADGSVRFISEKAALEVVLRMAIRDDGVEPQSP